MRFDGQAGVVVVYLPERGAIVNGLRDLAVPGQERLFPVLPESYRLA